MFKRVNFEAFLLDFYRTKIFSRNDRQDFLIDFCNFLYNTSKEPCHSQCFYIVMYLFGVVLSSKCKYNIVKVVNTKLINGIH